MSDNSFSNMSFELSDLSAKEIYNKYVKLLKSYRSCKIKLEKMFSSQKSLVSDIKEQSEMIKRICCQLLKLKHIFYEKYSENEWNNLEYLEGFAMVNKYI